MLSKKLPGLFIAFVAIASLTACDVDQIEIKNTDGEKAVVDVTTTKEETTKEETKVTATDVEYRFPQELETKDVLANYMDVIQAEIPKNYGEGNNYVIELMHFYDVGEIKVSPYTGQRLLVLELDCDGPCFAAQIIRFAWDKQSGELNLLANHSMIEYVPDFLKTFYDAADEDLVLESLQLPKTVMLPDGSDSIKLKIKDADIKTSENAGGDQPFGLTFVSLGKVAFTDPNVGDVYLAEGHVGCLFVIGQDNVLSSYEYDPALIDSVNGQSVKWEDSSPTTYLGGSYALKSGGCGIGGACYFIEDISEDQIEKVGKTNMGIDLYASKNTERVEENTELDKLIDTDTPLWDLNYSYNMYVSMSEYMHEDSESYTVKSYDEFLNEHPVLYWKDPFGRYAGIINTEYKPPAECGKPVIYLYPETQTTVNVQVDIDEFTATEPAYADNGWTVIAKPNGELMNLADGLEYEYLFWEGISKKKLQMNSGFMVPKSELKSFLTSSLAKLGLNTKESADFREFWLPKMQATAQPYVFVSFAGTTDFNKVAPLSIEPKPDTVIRVFMYYEPMWQKIDLPEQKLSAPERNGFTVVEWGGTSSDGWQIR